MTAPISLLLALWLTVMPSVAAPGLCAESLPAHVRRGDEVVARYSVYRQHLEEFHTRLRDQLRVDAPDLDAKLKAAPPAPVSYGYQILPTLVPDEEKPPGASHVTTGSYSWRRTESFIERGGARLGRLEAAVEPTTPIPLEGHRREQERMVKEYLALVKDQRIVESHIQYNRLWQGEIHRLRAVYDGNTAIYDALIEREAVLDALAAGDLVLAPSLHAREQALLRQIRARPDRIARPPFLRVEQPEPRRFTVHVPLFTDLEDPAFVEAFRAAVERAWLVRDDADEFRVAIDIRHVAPAQLYAPVLPPAPGKHIDLRKHVDRFPSGGGVLTTGATTTHVLGRAMILGPHDIAPNVLAHELGHILGLPDAYFRGYRDRGAEGYEVLEVVPDLADIMSAPGVGRVQRHHFDLILGR